MLNNPTSLKLRDMKLKVMAQMMDEPDPAMRELSFEERLGIMVEKEWMSRKNSKIKRQLYSATLGLNACLEDIDYAADRTIDKLEAASPSWLVHSAITHAEKGIQLNTIGFQNSFLKSKMLRTIIDIQNS